MPIVFQIKAKIIKNIAVKPKYCKIWLKAGAIAKAAGPGQFVQIKIDDSPDILLRRPFSVHRVKGGNIEILYQVVGKATEALAKKKAGEYLDIIGPLGSDFSSPFSVLRSPFPVLVAGGMGVAPLIFLAEKLTKSKVKNSPVITGSRQRQGRSKTLVLLGAKTKDDILCEKEFRQLGCEVKIATDDGSKGFHGYVSGLLKSLLRTVDCRLWTIYACGPRLMLKEICTIAKRYKMAAQISLEEHLACGLGACLGCVVNTRDGYRRVCKEGPVFQANQLILGKE